MDNNDPITLQYFNDLQLAQSQNLSQADFAIVARELAVRRDDQFRQRFQMENLARQALIQQQQQRVQYQQQQQNMNV